MTNDALHKSRWQIAASWLKPGLLLVYLACDYQAIAERISSLGLSPPLGMYLVLYGLMALGLLGAAYIARAVIRVPAGVVLAASSVALHSYEWATRHVLDYNAFETMLASHADSGDALAQHGDVLWQAVPVALILLAAIALPPGRPRVPARLAYVAPLAAIALLSGILYVRGGEGARALPAPFVPLAHGAIKLGVTFTEAGQNRQPVRIGPVGPPVTHDIVLIVDESIAPRYLDINSPHGVRSGLAESRDGIGVHNFGVAAAITNCSAGSNRSLRFGGTRDNYRVVGRTQPSIWAYAREAGLRTVYLDGQRIDGALQNLMTATEREEIDDFIQFPAVPVLNRDMEMGRILKERINNGVPEFILVNKVGAHFPVADKFPESHALHRPFLPRGNMKEITDMGPVHAHFHGDAEFWRRYRNAYRNTITWNVGAFFDRLLDQLNPENAVLLYTADHGQDLHEGGHLGKATHCVNDPLPEEGAVPLVVIDSVLAPRMDWQDGTSRHKDASSHFRIFPTLLELMGYARSDVAPIYGPTLVAPDSDPMTFTINYFAALGREPAWRKIAAERLVQPPEADMENPRK